VTQDEAVDILATLPPGRPDNPEFQEWWDRVGYEMCHSFIDFVTSSTILAQIVYEEAKKIGAAEERERCAKAVESEHVGQFVDDECDNEGDRAYNMALRHAAAAIRARGQANG